MRRAPNHSLGAALAVGPALAAHAVCWALVFFTVPRGF